jgi:hypothetical protein
VPSFIDTNLFVLNWLFGFVVAAPVVMAGLFSWFRI